VQRSFALRIEAPEGAVKDMLELQGPMMVWTFGSADIVMYLE
jgi:hypothetical protein